MWIYFTPLEMENILQQTGWLSVRNYGVTPVLYAALPWDYISQEEFSKMPDERKLMGHAFYDIENKVFSSILQHGFDLLSEDGIILP